MGKLKQAAPEPLAGINKKVATWKEAHIAQVRAEIDNETARGAVKSALVAAGVKHVTTPTGTIALQDRSGSTTTDWEGIAKAWEALARKHIDEKVIEDEEPFVGAYVRIGAPSVVLSAPLAWGVEAKAQRDPRD